jgi:hypothetical protein
MGDDPTALVGARWPALADVRAMLATPVSEDRRAPRVSIYLDLPDRPGFPDLRALRTAYEDVVERVAERMAQLGLGKHETREAGERLLELELHAGGLPPARGSLAVFLSERRGLSAFVLDRNVGSGGAVGRSYRLRPLLADAQANASYRVLALAINRVALYEGDAHTLRPVERDGVPASLAEALGRELEPPRIQGHVVGPGASTLIQHGHGAGPDERRVDLDRFHREIASAVARVWSDRRDPLVLFADKSHQGRFHGTARDLSGLLDEGVAGNPDRLSPHEVHRATWPIALAHLRRGERCAADLVRDAVAHGGTVVGLEGAAMAALAGRVVRLWVDRARRAPVHVDSQSGALVEPWGDEDAIDEVAAHVVARGGTVVVCDAAEMPSPAGIAAELRGDGAHQ